MTSVFGIPTTSHLKRKAFFDGPIGIARYDQVKYPWVEKLTEKQWGFFWRPREVSLERDARDFKQLTDFEKHIFLSNLKRQTVLDTVQGRAPLEVFGPITSLPEIEAFLTVWQAFEQIHSRSYTWIMQNAIPNPSLVFDDLLNIPEITDLVADIAKYYDDLGRASPEWPHYQKECLWKCLHAVNALEGIRFYVSFACSWAFAELNKMEGNAKIIKLICRDENVHLAFTQQMIKALPQEDDYYAILKDDDSGKIRDIFAKVVEQEKAWAKYLFKDGSIIGLNERVLCDYVDWIAHKRMTAIGLEPFTKGGSNPLPWTAKWIAGADVQVAPQETEITNYIVGGVKQDVTTETLKRLTL